MDEIMHAVKDYILTTFLPGEDPNALTPAMPLRTSGILDSLATLELVAFLEKRFGIELAAHETGVDRMGTLTDIAKLVQSKLPRGA